MRTLIFLVALGSGYGVAHALGASNGWAAAAGWGAGIAVFLLGRRRGYRAAVHVERNRSAAELLREQDPEAYWRIVHQADGSEAEPMAQGDPDAYVALFLAAAKEHGHDS